MKILLSNDDGYRASGIVAAFNALTSAGHEVTISAPELNFSGSGQSINVYSPMTIIQVDEKTYFVTSTPADSVRLGLQVIYGSKKNYPDLIISGINLGENISEDILYSGTVGAAREGAIHGIASIAVSTPGIEFPHLDSAGQIIVDIVNKLKKSPKILKPAFIWNINIPNITYENILGYEITTLGRRKIHKPLKKQVTSRGKTIYWQGEAGDFIKSQTGTDVDVFMQNEKISITPLNILHSDLDQRASIIALGL